VKRPIRSEFDGLFRRYRRDAVLLHRPYPPHAGRRTNSRLGGLPGLPAHFEWPRTAGGTALHFIAQVDCADIGFSTPLPERGVLFFFQRDDDEQEWNNDGSLPADHFRVLYATDASPGTPRREAPADLRQFGGSVPRMIWPGFAHEGGRGPNLRAEWPVHPLPMPSWPDALPGYPDSLSLSFYEWARYKAPSAETWSRWRASLVRMLGSEPTESWKDAEAREGLYKVQLEQLRVDAFTEVTGEQPARPPHELAPNPRAGMAIFVHAEDGPEAYPQYWTTVRHCALALLYRPSRVLGADPAQLASAAEEWLRRAKQAGLDEPVPEAERGAFRAWLAGLRASHDGAPISYDAADLVFASMYATIGDWAGDPTRAARVPPAVYETLRYVFDAFSGSRVSFWQMLGHAPSPQRPSPPDDPAVCLLADPGGFTTFWIAPHDLARRDFSKAWGKMEGD